MARIIVRGENPAVVETGPALSLLNALVRDGVRIRHDCGGKALCGTCRVRIESGASSLSPMDEREKGRLSAVGAGEGDRLACQTHAYRDVEIALPERNDARTLD